jgi:hypothetical protein
LFNMEPPTLGTETAATAPDPSPRPTDGVKSTTAKRQEEEVLL